MMNDPLVVIPARFSSSRLPGKVMELIHGYPMVYWTYKRAVAAAVGDVLVAVDDDAVAQHLRRLGVPTIMTSNNLENGTERVLAVACARKEYNRFINVQADEPLLDPASLRAVASSASWGKGFYTAVSEISSGLDPTEVKVAMTSDNRIVYASRAAIPFSRDGEPRYLKIQGVYAYDLSTLEQYMDSPVGPLEREEKVEQLRCIESGIPLLGVKVSCGATSIDTMEDLLAARRVDIKKYQAFEVNP